ncbi:unnamed protein product, partial [Urochloa humidicola]
ARRRAAGTGGGCRSRTLLHRRGSRPGPAAHPCFPGGSFPFFSTRTLPPPAANERRPPPSPTAGAGGGGAPRPDLERRRSSGAGGGGAPRPDLERRRSPDAASAEELRRGGSMAPLLYFLPYPSPSSCCSVLEPARAPRLLNWPPRVDGARAVHGAEERRNGLGLLSMVRQRQIEAGGGAPPGRGGAAPADRGRRAAAGFFTAAAAASSLELSVDLLFPFFSLSGGWGSARVRGPCANVALTVRPRHPLALPRGGSARLYRPPLQGKKR